MQGAAAPAEHGRFLRGPPGEERSLPLGGGRQVGGAIRPENVGSERRCRRGERRCRPSERRCRPCGHPAGQSVRALAEEAKVFRLSRGPLRIHSGC